MNPGKICYVVCQNDYPDSVYLDKDKAQKVMIEKIQQEARNRANDKSRQRIYYHMQIVEFVE